jgi:WD40 repeat protein
MDSVCCPHDIAFSPDGRLLASATGFISGDESVKLWDVATGQLVHQLTGHTELLYQVAFSPDGKTLASSSKDNTIRLWDLTTGTTLRTITPAGPAFAFSPDGKVLAYGVCTRRGGHGECVQGLITLSDVATGQEIRSWQEGLTSGVSLVAFSPNGKSLAAASSDSTDPACGMGTSVVNLRDVTTGNLIRTFSFGCPYNPKDPLSVPYEPGLAFSPDGSVVVGGAYVGFRLWRVATGQELRYLPGAVGPLFANKEAAYSPDGKLLALQFNNGGATELSKLNPGLRIFYVGDLAAR